MKRHFMKSLMALCAGVMTLGAASSLVVSCDKYDDTELRDQISALDKRVQNLEALKAKLEELTSRVDALYTLKFQVNDNNELQYSFDGGKTWTSTGIVLAAECDCEPCQYVPCDHECPEVSLVDNGDSVTIKVGDAEFTIEKPEEIVFELRAGKLYFESEGTMTVSIKSSGIEDITVMAAPKGWWAEINSEGKVEITAPEYESTQSEGYWNDDWTEYIETPATAAASGYVKVHACSVDGKCMVGKLPVEVVKQALVVKAYAGNAYFTLAGTASYYNPTFFYGVSTKENLVADTQDLLSRMNEGDDWDIYDEYLNNYEEASVTASIADLLGEEPKLGEEYVVWAVLESSTAMPYDSEDLVIAYYSPVQVKVTEVEDERTAYNVTVNVEVVGAESYVAVAMPQNYCASEEEALYQAEQMAMAMAQGMYFGKLYTESYTGSALDIAAGTNYSMTGLYAPASDVWVMVLPVDSRSGDEYTADDVTIVKFSTADLTAGGAVNLSVKQVYEYMGKVFSYDDWQYHEQLIKLDPYTQIGVEVVPSATTDWSAFYYSFLDEATYNTLSVSDEALVGYLLEGWGMTPEDVDAWPNYLVENVDPATSLYFVAFMVDKTGKYGEVAKLPVSSKELVKADLFWADPYTTNLVDGSLKNTVTLEFTPVLEEGEAASYMYVMQQTDYYNPYEGMDDAQLAETIFFSSDAVTVTADDLVDGKIVVDGHAYGNNYIFAVIPLDADGAPGKSAAILEYSCDFAISEVVTEGAAFDATEPEIVINLPEEFFADGAYGDASYYGYEFMSYYKKYQFYYEFNYVVKPVDGTTVSAVLVDADAYTMGEDAATKAGQVWQGSLGSYYTVVATEETEASYRYFKNFEDEVAPDVYLCVSWTDADGNYYYKEYSLQAELQKLATKMHIMLYGPTPAGKQWAFDWAEYAAMMEVESMPACMDLGVSIENYWMAGINYEALYGPEAAGMWMAGMEASFEIEPTDETSGIIWLYQADYSTGEAVRSGQIEYYDLTETTCSFNSPDLFLSNIEATLMTEPVNVMSQGIGW